MDYLKTVTLDCGVRVVLEKIESVQSVAFGVWVKTGAVDEYKEVSGISHYIEHMMFKGTEKRNAKQIAEDMDRIGAQMNAFTGKEATCYYFKSISDNLEKGAEIILDMVSNSVFDKKELSRERSVIFEEMKMTEDQPDDLANDTIIDMVFKGTPLGKSIIGTRTALKSINHEIMTEYKKKEYTRDSIVVSVAGNFDEERLLEFLQDKFEKIEKNKAEKNEVFEPYKKSFKVIKKDIQQSHICLATRGYKTGEELQPSLKLLTNIMGGSMSSRLFQNIREEKGLAYSVYSVSSSYKDAGYFMIYAGVAHDKIEAALDGIKEELAILDKNGISEEELEMSKVQIKTAFVFGQENIGSRMFGNGKDMLILGRVRTAEEILNGFNSANMETINEAKKIICNPDAYSGVCVSDKKFNLERIWNR